jgi:hypothetical protein
MGQELENAQIQKKLDLDPQEAAKDSVLRFISHVSCNPKCSISMRLAVIAGERPVNLPFSQKVSNLSVS